MQLSIDFAHAYENNRSSQAYLDTNRDHLNAHVTSSAVKKNGKILITEKQKQQFNIMLNALKKIKAYQTPDRLRKDSEKDWGLDFEEAIEMAYENIQGEAAFASKNVKPLQ